MWLPILQGHVTLGELKRDYTLEDLCDLHFAMFDFEELKENGDNNR